MAASPQQIRDVLLGVDENDDTRHKKIGELASSIEKGIVGASDVSTGENQLTQLWNAVIDAVKSTSYKDETHHQKLVDSVVTLQNRPSVDQNGGDRVFVSNMHLWSDLPLLGWALRDAWNISLSESTSDEEKAAWININAWTARLMAHSAFSQKNTTDVSLFGLWTIRTALEESDQVNDTTTAAAAVWFTQSATVMRRLSTEGKTFDGKSARPGPKFESEGWRGFNQDRWRAWSQRLESMASRTNDVETSHLIDQARAAIDKAGE